MPQQSIWKRTEFGIAIAVVLLGLLVRFGVTTWSELGATACQTRIGDEVARCASLTKPAQKPVVIEQSATTTTSAPSAGDAAPQASQSPQTTTTIAQQSNVVRLGNYELKNCKLKSGANPEAFWADYMKGSPNAEPYWPFVQKELCA